MTLNEMPENDIPAWVMESPTPEREGIPQNGFLGVTEVDQAVHIWTPVILYCPGLLLQLDPRAGGTRSLGGS